MTAPAVRAAAAVPAAPWAGRRERAEALCERYPFAREPLSLYRALVDVQEAAWSAARTDPPVPGDLPRYTAERVLPGVLAATAAAGPRALADFVRGQFASTSDYARTEMVQHWLAGGAAEQTPVERYLARASAGPVLEALGDRAGEACAPERRVDDESGRRPDADGRHCPVCGGLPQLAYFAAPPESLAAGPRSLLCSRCAGVWTYPRLTCASCGEPDTAKLTVLAEEGVDERALSGSAVRGLRGRSPVAAGTPSPRFPHMRVDACTTCSRYLLSMDLGRDPRAVPAVDELAAIPLDLYAVDRGFTKVVPNLMGA